MRVLLVHPGPNFSVADVYRGWARAFDRLGVGVVPFNYDDRLQFYERSLNYFDPDGESRHGLDAVRLASKGIEAACYEVWPDAVLLVSGFYVPPATIELIRSRGTKVWLLCTESPYEDSKQLQLAPVVDGVLLNDPANLHAFRVVNPNSYYVPHAYDPEIHRRVTPRPEQVSQFCFVGTGYPSRVEYFEAVDWSGIDAAFAGNWNLLDDDSPLRAFLAHEIEFCCENSDAVALYSGADASVNIYRTEAAEGSTAAGSAMTPREVELAAIGCFYLTEPRQENREVLPMVPTVDGPEDFSEKLRWWLDRPDKRAEVTAAAREAIAPRTFDANAAAWLRMVEG